jgi:hypothetical protein
MFSFRFKKLDLFITPYQVRPYTFRKFGLNKRAVPKYSAVARPIPDEAPVLE